MWSEAVLWVCWLWSLLGDLVPGTPGMSYKVICRWPLLVLMLEVPRSQAANHGWLPLVLGLGMFYKKVQGTPRPDAADLQQIRGPLGNFRKVCSMSQDRPFLVETPLEVAWVGPKVGWGSVSGHYQG